MSKQKEIIQKLFKTAANQQKIIQKLAQQLGMDSDQLGAMDGDVVSIAKTVGAVLRNMPEAKDISVKSCQVAADGTVNGKLVIPSGMTSFLSVTDKLKAMLLGKKVMGDDGVQCVVTTDKNKISFIGETL